MEKVVWIDTVNKLMHIDVKKYNRIYIGADSCPNLLPTKNELLKYFNFAIENDLKITLLTSFSYQIHIDKFKDILFILDKYSKKLDLEIVINDWGIFNLIKNFDFKLVLGRLLTKQKKGPRVFNIKDNLTENQVNLFGEIHSEFFQDFLINNKFIRIELDNSLIGVNYNGQIPATLYFPYVFVSPSSFCVYHSKITKNKGDCKRECIKNFLILDNKEFNSLQYRKGNAFFYKNKKLPQNKNNINRIVLFDTI